MTLNHIDFLPYAKTFATQGWVQIENILADAAADSLLNKLEQWPEWNLVTRLAGQHRSFDAAAMLNIAADQREAFLNHVYAEATKGFQYLYERFPLYDRAMQQQALDPDFAALFQLLRSEAFMQLLKNISGCQRITFTDGQITQYRAGHFLTLHDDKDDAAGRELAFVLNLSKNWQPDFGGFLQFLDGQGNIEHALLPKYNSLAIFQVPKPHAVSYIPPYVSLKRFAITGWARSGVERYGC